MRWPLRRSFALAGATVLALAGVATAGAPAQGSVSLAPAAAAAVSTSITVNGTASGPVFGGIGAISGGGGNSRLLTDYPAAQQQAILDYLFKPGYGADLQILKTEIGGDTNSTDGSESSIEHSSGSISCTAGYEFWLMEQAKALNPNIKLYALAWGAPGWISGGFWSTGTINYLISYLNCAKSDGLTINYLGGWNERNYNISWYEQLRSTLNADGYSAVQIVGADSGWGIAGDIADNSTFANAVSIIGVHYPCGYLGTADSCAANSTAESTGKALWASEGGSQNLNSGTGDLIRSITRGYTDANLTGYINWPVVASIYTNEPFNSDGLIEANQPWSGAYSVGSSLWATAQVTQFTSPGWQFLKSGSGYLGGTESNGTYISLKSTNNSDYSTIIETTTATAAQTVTLHVTGGLSTGTVHVWSTNVNSPSATNQFVQQASITPSGGAYTLTLQPGYVYSLTTTSGQGKGTAASPASGSLSLPYSDNFDGEATGQQPKYLAQQQGAFEVEPCAGGRSGKCVQQQTAVEPIEWDANANPNTFGGNQTWSNYTVSADALLEQSGAVQLLGRVGSQDSETVNNINEYYLQLSNTGAWAIVRNNTSGTRTTLASGTVTAPGLNTWQHLALTFSGSTITAAINGTTVGSANDSTFSSGMVGFATSGYQIAQFDNLSVTAGSGSTSGGGEIGAVGAGKCLDVPNGSTTEGTQVDIWDCNGNSNQEWTSTAGQLTVYSGADCLDAYKGGTTAGTIVDIWPCTGGTNQKWSLNSNGTITGTASGLCLDVTGTSTVDGALGELWTCNGGSNQQWTGP